MFFCSSKFCSLSLSGLVLLLCIAIAVVAQDCEIVHPPGSEGGTDSSGVRSQNFPSSLRVGQSVSYACPDKKESAREGSGQWEVQCVQGEAGPQLSYPWGSSWPQCECPTTATCQMGDAGLASYSPRYAYEISAGESPGLDLTIPLPIDADLLSWKVKVTWDMPVRSRDILVSSRTPLVSMSRVDFMDEGRQHWLRPQNTTATVGQGALKLDIHFDFLNSTIAANSQPWHYPCIVDLECSFTEEPSNDYMGLAIVLGGVVLVMFLASCCCAACVWCMQQDGTPRALSAISTRINSPNSIRQMKVKPYPDSPAWE